MDFPGLEPAAVPVDSPLHRSQRYLAAAYDSVSNLFEVTYPALRAQRDGQRGRLTHAEHDVFRAAIVFAGAGVDAVFKEALRSCVPIQVGRSEGAREKYLDFVTRYIQDGPEVDARKVAALLTAPSSDEALKASYVYKLTGSSLQSVDQVTTALSALGLQDETALYKDARELRGLFSVRNQIAHELDMTPSSAKGRGARHRRERPITSYQSMSHTGLNYAQRTLNSLQARIA